MSKTHIPDIDGSVEAGPRSSALQSPLLCAHGSEHQSWDDTTHNNLENPLPRSLEASFHPSTSSVHLDRAVHHRMLQPDLLHQLPEKPLQQNTASSQSSSSQSSSSQPPLLELSPPPNLYVAALGLTSEFDIQRWWLQLVNLLVESFHAQRICLTIPHDTNDPFHTPWGVKAVYNKVNSNTLNQLPKAEKGKFKLQGAVANFQQPSSNLSRPTTDHSPTLAERRVAAASLQGDQNATGAPTSVRNAVMDMASTSATTTDSPDAKGTSKSNDKTAPQKGRSQRPLHLPICFESLQPLENDSEPLIDHWGIQSLLMRGNKPVVLVREYRKAQASPESIFSVSKGNQSLPSNEQPMSAAEENREQFKQAMSERFRRDALSGNFAALRKLSLDGETTSRSDDDSLTQNLLSEHRLQSGMDSPLFQQSSDMRPSGSIDQSREVSSRQVTNAGLHPEYAAQMADQMRVNTPCLLSLEEGSNPMGLTQPRSEYGHANAGHFINASSAGTPSSDSHGFHHRPVPDYDDYEQPLPSPWSQSPAPSPALNDPDQNPFFQSIPDIDDDAFNPDASPIEEDAKVNLGQNTFSNAQAAEFPYATPAQNAHSILHIPIAHPASLGLQRKLSQPRPAKSTHATGDPADEPERTSTTRIHGVPSPHLTRHDSDRQSEQNATPPSTSPSTSTSPLPMAILSFLSPLVPYPKDYLDAVTSLAPFVAVSLSSALMHSNLTKQLKFQHHGSTFSAANNASSCRCTPGSNCPHRSDGGLGSAAVLSDSSNNRESSTSPEVSFNGRNLSRHTTSADLANRLFQGGLALGPSISTQRPTNGRPVGNPMPSTSWTGDTVEDQNMLTPESTTTTPTPTSYYRSQPKFLPTPTMETPISAPIPRIERRLSDLTRERNAVKKLTESGDDVSLNRLRSAQRPLVASPSSDPFLHGPVESKLSPSEPANNPRLASPSDGNSRHSTQTLRDSGSSGSSIFSTASSAISTNPSAGSDTQTSIAISNLALESESSSTMQLPPKSSRVPENPSNVDRFGNIELGKDYIEATNQLQQPNPSISLQLVSALEGDGDGFFHRDRKWRNSNDVRSAKDGIRSASGIQQAVATGGITSRRHRRRKHRIRRRSTGTSTSQNIGKESMPSNRATRPRSDLFVWRDDKGEEVQDLDSDDGDLFEHLSEWIGRGDSTRALRQTGLASPVVNPKPALLRSIVDGIPIHVLTRSPITGKTTWVNQRILQYTGLPMQALLGDNWISVVHPDDAETCKGGWSRAFSEGVGFSGQFRTRRFDGVYRWFLWRIVPVRDVRGKIIHWFGSCTDVHDQKLAEEMRTRQIEAEAKEKKYRLLAEAIPQIVFTSDPELGITYANDKWFSYSGQSFEQTCGLGFMSHVHPLDRGKLKMPDVDDQEVGEVSWQQELRLRSKDDQYRWFLVKCISMESNENGKRRWLGTCTDINDQKLLENKLKEAHDAAQKSTESKTRFLSNMSHEIRTPLIGITGMINFMLDTELTPEQTDYALTISQSAESLLVVINDILDLSKVEAGMMKLEMEPFSVATMIEDANELLSTLAVQKGLELSFWIEQRVPDVVQGDRIRLRQVLLNLIGNAIKFTTTGEIFTMCTVKEFDKDKSQLTLMFEVVDTGSGFDAQDETSMFKPFSQVDTSSTRKHGGSGLGLVISRQLIELHGGWMKAKSVKGQGSTFYFTVVFTVPPSSTQPRPQTPKEECGAFNSPFSRGKNVFEPQQAHTLDTSRGPSQSATPLENQDSHTKISEASSTSSTPMTSGSSGHREAWLHTDFEQSLAHRAAGMKLQLPTARGTHYASSPGSASATQLTSEQPRPSTIIKSASSPQSPPRLEDAHILMRALIICEWPRSRLGLVEHVKRLYPRNPPPIIDQAKSHIEATEVLTQFDVEPYDHVLINLNSASQVLDLVRLIQNSRIQQNKLHLLIITTPIQRAAIAAEGGEKLLGSSDFVFKPIKRSKLEPFFVQEIAFSHPRAKKVGMTQQLVQNQKDVFRKMQEDVGGRGYKVLLIEDNPVNQKVMIKYLQRVGLEVDVASDGVQGLELFYQHPYDYYDLILCDLFMPFKDGYETAEEIREWERTHLSQNARSRPIIALSANVMSDVMEQCLAKGFSSYISKPVDFGSLSDAIRKYIDPDTKG